MPDVDIPIVDMTRHKSCPFCGGEPVVRADDLQEPVQFRYYQPGCTDMSCPGYWLRNPSFVSEEDAWDVWDSRYVEECEYEFLSNMTMGPVSLDCCGLRCSNCGREQMDLMSPNFCPDCGYRVRKPERDVSEDGYVEWRQ